MVWVRLLTGDIAYSPVIHTSVISQFSTHIFSADITPELLKLCRFTKAKVFFLVLVYVFNFDSFEFSAAILEKGLFESGGLTVKSLHVKNAPKNAPMTRQFGFVCEENSGREIT